MAAGPARLGRAGPAGLRHGLVPHAARRLAGAARQPVVGAYPDNHPKRARACMRRFYALVRLTYGEPANPAKAAELEVDWWRVHREIQHEPGRTPDELVESLVRLYCYLYGEPEEAVRPAAVHRAKAMDLSDQWVADGCQPDSHLLPLEHAALVRAYAALLAAVHH